MKTFNTEEVMMEIRDKIKKDVTDEGSPTFISAYHAKILRMIKEKQELIIFGSGLFGKTVLDDLKRCGLSSVQCFCDNNRSRIGEEIKGYKIVSPEEAFMRYPKAAFIITPRGYENEILLQLSQLGVQIENIILYNAELAGLVD